MKKDSANGRLLIWQCSGKLISRNPVLEYGGSGFTVNYGIVGLCLTLLLIVVPLRASWKNNSPELFIIRLSLLSIGICALFSYPFNYPFIRLLAVAFLAFALSANSQQSITLRNGYLPKGIAILFSLGLLSVTAYQGFYEYEWHRIAHKSLRGQTVQMLPRYKKLHRHLRYKDLFLYNYAAELNVVGNYEKSLQIARECNLLWADYDLHMLMAENCLQLEYFKETEQHLTLTAAMCPVKFMPLYQLVELYLEIEQEEEAQVLAQKILDKKVKIPSLVINSIKIKMRNLLNEPDSLDDSIQLIKLDIKTTVTSSWQDCLLDPPDSKGTPAYLKQGGIICVFNSGKSPVF